MIAKSSPFVGAVGLLFALVCCSFSADAVSHVAASVLMTVCDSACDHYSALFNPFHH
jgi:hypothetical protein